jgi:hypothetical protein
VEARTQVSQRQVRLGRKDQDEEPRPEVQRPVDQPQANSDGDKRNGERGRQFQGEGGEECNTQSGHALSPVVVCDALKTSQLGRRSPEDPQGRQTGDHIQEVAGEPGQRVPATLASPHRVGTDKRHEERNERDRQGYGQGSHEIRRRQAGDHDDRDDHRQHRLRQVAAEVRIKRIQAACCKSDDFTAGVAALAAAVASRKLCCHVP